MKKTSYKVIKHAAGYMAAGPESGAIGDSIRIAKVRAKGNATYSHNVGRMYLRDNIEITGAVGRLKNKTKEELKLKYKKYSEK